jgi:hypothetical protein
VTRTWFIEVVRENTTQIKKSKNPNSTFFPVKKQGSWCGCRDLNPGYQLGKLVS